MFLLIIFKMLSQETFVRGEYIIREGTSGDSFYLLADGEVDCILVLITNTFARTIIIITIVLLGESDQTCGRT